MFQVVLCNCPDEDVAFRISEIIVKEKLAACVNILPKITSIYSWQGTIKRDSEVMLMIKTKQSLYTELEQCIKKYHPYDVAEVIALDIQQGSAQYLDWITNTVKEL
ncbi:divalent-cation tolerance protein CutA [Thalassotalea crassostreae]|uniref:divalent-cation tolerance protein CutA n=1 Tax=Thalassotalea crassostreae TaxID=1763536 RepID=UPI000839352E|nr:divalent-cation tolerance protein CutA [Thalassotalea crassostreae]